MNAFLYIGWYFVSFAAMVLVIAASLFVVAIVGRKLLQLQADHASWARLASAQRLRMESAQQRLSDRAYEGFEAEIDAIYYATPQAEARKVPVDVGGDEG